MTPHTWPVFAKVYMSGWDGASHEFIFFLKLRRRNSLQVSSEAFPSEVFLGKGVLKICRKFTGEHPGQRAISIKLFYNFTEIAHGHEGSPVNLLHILRTPFYKNTIGMLLLIFKILPINNDDAIFKNSYRLKSS